MADQNHDDNVIPAPGPDETHPLPSDMREDGKDATGGNAPFAPADITPVSDVELDENHEQRASSKSSKKSQASHDQGRHHLEQADDEREPDTSHD